jgi:hypothetical protein
MGSSGMAPLREVNSPVMRVVGGKESLSSGVELMSSPNGVLLLSAAAMVLRQKIIGGFQRTGLKLLHHGSHQKKHCLAARSETVLGLGPANVCTVSLRF